MPGVYRRDEPGPLKSSQAHRGPATQGGVFGTGSCGNEERPMSRNPVGRPPDLVREAWCLRYGLKWRRTDHQMPDSLMRQLSFCKSDAARRLILGIPPPKEDTNGKA